MENLKQRNIIIHMKVFSTKTEAPKKFFELFFHLKSIWTFGKEPIVITLIGWVDGKHKKKVLLFPSKQLFFPIYLCMYWSILSVPSSLSIKQYISHSLNRNLFSSFHSLWIVFRWNCVLTISFNSLLDFIK